MIVSYVQLQFISNSCIQRVHMLTHKLLNEQLPSDNGKAPQCCVYGLY